jgi:hypothetical protein
LAGPIGVTTPMVRCGEETRAKISIAGRTTRTYLFYTSNASNGSAAHPTFR